MLSSLKRLPPKQVQHYIITIFTVERKIFSNGEGLRQQVKLVSLNIVLRTPSDMSYLQKIIPVVQHIPHKVIIT